MQLILYSYNVKEGFLPGNPVRLGPIPVADDVHQQTHNSILVTNQIHRTNITRIAGVLWWLRSSPTCAVPKHHNRDPAVMRLGIFPDPYRISFKMRRFLTFVSL